MKTESVNHHLQEKLKNPYFRELYEIEAQKLSIVKHIVQYRIKHKLSQSSFSKMMHLSQQHISKIENGVFSNVMTLEKVLLFIGYTVSLKVTKLSPAIAVKINHAMKSSRQVLAA